MSENETRRDDFAMTQETGTAETAISAAAAQAQAAVQARYVVAMKFPRDLDQARVTLLKECRRPSFADAATYELSFGKTKVSGPSIRLAEAAVRAMRNISSEVMTIFDSEEKRIVRVTVTDLESNATYSQDVVVSKYVERRFLKDGQVAIRSRKNAQNEDVHLVAATESDLAAKAGALVSKAIRTLSLRLVPGDLVEEALEQCKATLLDGAKADPDAARKKLADAFAGMGVQPAALKDYLGHDLASCTPAEIVDLRGVFSALKDGARTWTDVMEARAAEKDAKAAEGVKVKSSETLKAEAKAAKAAEEKKA